MPEIPEDLQIEILSRIPAKLVTRFRGLSKFHRTLIDGPYFIEKHGERATNCNQIIVYRHTEASDDMVMLDLTKFRAKKERLANALEEKHFDVVGCCAGILCLLRRQEGRILLWNPLTGSGRRIIPGKYPIDDTDEINCYFGHDEVTDDLKILKVWGEHNCEIYSSRAGCWREYEIDNNNGLRLRLSDRGIFVKGTNSVHVYNRSYNKPSIAAFDLASDKFNKIDVPLECDKWYDTWELSEFHGNLSIISRKRGSFLDYSLFSVWVMKEYGVEESWTCILSLDRWVYNLLIKPLGFVNDRRQFLLLWKIFNSKHEFCVYDLDKYKEISNQMISPFIDYRRVKAFVYTPSLRRV